MAYPNNAGAESQMANVVPPRDGGVLAFAFTTSSARKALSNINVNTKAPTAGGTVYLTLYADQKWWYRLSGDATATVDETAIDASGVSAITMQANAGVEVQAYQTVDIRIDRLADLYLVLKGAAAGTMRGWVSSHMQGDT